MHSSTARTKLITLLKTHKQHMCDMGIEFVNINGIVTKGTQYWPKHINWCLRHSSDAGLVLVLAHVKRYLRDKGIETE